MNKIPSSELDGKDKAIYLMWESSQARIERINKWQFIVILVLIFALIGTNAGWLFYENQFEEVVVTQEVEATADGDSDLNLNTIGGDYNVGESESNANN